MSGHMREAGVFLVTLAKVLRKQADEVMTASPYDLAAELVAFRCMRAVDVLVPERREATQALRECAWMARWARRKGRGGAARQDSEDAAASWVQRQQLEARMREFGWIK